MMPRPHTGPPGIPTGGLPGNPPGGRPTLLPGQVRFGQNNMKVGFDKGGPNHKPPLPGGGGQEESDTNDSGYDPIQYGEKGKKTGIAKIGQARNQPGFIPRGQREGGTPGYPGGNGPPDGPSDPLDPGNFLNTLKPKQQERVQRLLGDSYDPSKPLNVQLAKALWATLDAKGRHAWAQNQRENGNWILDGAHMGTVHGVKDAYDEMLQRTNQMLQMDFNDTFATMSGGGTGLTNGNIISGPAMSPAEIEAQRAGLMATLAANPSFATPEQVASFENSWAMAAKQYTIAVNQGQKLQHLAARLGITPDKILPPDIEERLARASLGYNINGQPLDNIPSAADIARYPGLAIAMAGMPHYTVEEAHNAWKDAGGRSVPRERDGGDSGIDLRKQSAQGVSNAAYGDPATMLYQPAFSSDQLQAEYI